MHKLTRAGIARDVVGNVFIRFTGKCNVTVADGL